MSHLFFGNAVKASSFFGSALASHPPLKRRIKGVLPAWDGSFLSPLIPKTLEQTKPQSSPREKLEAVMRERMGGAGVAEASATAAIPLLALIGNASDAHTSHARTLLDRIPSSLKDAARDAYGCRAVVYALLIHWRGDDQAFHRQMDALEATGDTGVVSLTRSLADDARRLDPDLRLPLLDLCLGALALLSETQHSTFRKIIHALARADDELTMSEWALLHIVETHLDERTGTRQAPRVRYYAMGQLGTQLSVLLGAIAYAGSREAQAAQQSFEAGAEVLRRGSGLAPDLAIPPEQELTPDKLNAVIEDLRALAPRMKQRLIQAAAVVIAHDHEVDPSEADLLRAFADLLGVPMPPLLPGQKLV